MRTGNHDYHTSSVTSILGRTPEKKPVSERKRAANQANAARSTGPKTAEGKAKVRENALKHGLRAEQVVLPWEDPAEFEAMQQTWIDEWKPPTDTRRALVELAASRAWRLRRCIKAERDHMARIGMKAADDHTEAIELRMERALRLLPVDPPRALEALRSERQGLEVLIGRWSRMADNLGKAAWWNNPEIHHGQLLNLLGFRVDADPGDIGEAGRASWRLIESNDPTFLPPGEPEVEPEEAGAAAKSLLRHVEAVIEHLGRKHAALPDPHLVRMQVAEEAAYAPSGEGLAFLRYEGHHDRAFRATLNQLIKVTQTGVDLVEEGLEMAQPPESDGVSTLVPVEPNKPTDPPAPAPRTVAPNKATEPTSPPVPTTEIAPIAAPNKATEGAPRGVSTTEIPPVDAPPNKATEGEPGRTPTRDREGRAWPLRPASIAVRDGLGAAGEHAEAEHGNEGLCRSD